MPLALDQLPPIHDTLLDEFDANNALYDYARTLAGIPENPPQIISGSSIPFECNMDLLNGIDYNKGCYIGQELVARTHYRGAVRKRLMPLVSLGSPSDVLSRANLPTSGLLNILQNTDLSVSSHEFVPQALLRKISGISGSNVASSSGKSHIPIVDVEVDPFLGLSQPFPTEGTPILPITSESELERVLSGKGLSSGVPAGAASASRVSKAVGGSSYNAGMGMMRDEAWHEAAPHLLFFAPSASNPASGTLLKGVKPWWYQNYLQWRSESEHKMAAQAAEEL